MSSVKFKSLDLETTANIQPGREGPGVFSVKGDDSLVLYVEPADTAVTGWIASIGYFFEGPLTVDESRVLYSSTDDQAVDGLVAPGGGLGEFQKAAGRYVTLDIPGGAVAGFVWLLATDGTVNVQVSTSS